MAQVGSYIPAVSATLGILDAVYLRYVYSIRFGSLIPSLHFPTLIRQKRNLVYSFITSYLQEVCVVLWDTLVLHIQLLRKSYLWISRVKEKLWMKDWVRDAYLI